MTDSPLGDAEILEFLLSNDSNSVSVSVVSSARAALE